MSAVNGKVCRRCRWRVYSHGVPLAITNSPFPPGITKYSKLAALILRNYSECGRRGVQSRWARPLFPPPPAPWCVRCTLGRTQRILRATSRSTGQKICFCYVFVPPPPSVAPPTDPPTPLDVSPSACKPSEIPGRTTQNGIGSARPPRRSYILSPYISHRDPRPP